MSYQVRVKNGIVLRIFGHLTQKGSSVAHSQYILYNMVGRSTVSISDLGGIFTSVLCALVNMAPQVGYIGYGPPYHTIYITYL